MMEDQVTEYNPLINERLQVCAIRPLDVPLQQVAGRMLPDKNSDKQELEVDILMETKDGHTFINGRLKLTAGKEATMPEIRTLACEQLKECIK